MMMLTTALVDDIPEIMVPSNQFTAISF